MKQLVPFACEDVSEPKRIICGYYPLIEFISCFMCRYQNPITEGQGILIYQNIEFSDLIDDDEIDNVEEILKKRKRQGVLKYLI